MSGILLLAPGASDERYLGRSGDALDSAIIEIVRTLGDPEGMYSVLVPWTRATAPLVLAASIDCVPSFDPESDGSSAASTRSRIIPYRPPGEEEREESDPFLNSSFMFLTPESVKPLRLALEEHRPHIVLAVGLPPGMAELAGYIEANHASMFVFSSLVGPEELSRSLLYATSGRVLDVELLMPEVPERDLEQLTDVEPDIRAESGLENYVPYGLLLQAVLEEILRNDHRGLQA